MPGQMVNYIHQPNGVCLPQDYNGKPTCEKYTEQLIRSLYILLGPFQIKKQSIRESSGKSRQSILNEFMPQPLKKYEKEKLLEI